MSLALFKFQEYLKASQKAFMFYEEIFLRLLGVNNRQPYLVPITVEDISYKDDNTEDCKQLDDHILWAAPKSRRSIEKRRTRRIGAVNYVCKLIPLKNLMTCYECGHPHEIGKLCPICYSKVKEVTDAIKEAMIKSNGRKPVEHDYAPIFKGERNSTDDEYYEGKRILEVPIERPPWFAKKLTQKSNVSLSTDTSISMPNPTHFKGGS